MRLWGGGRVVDGGFLLPRDLSVLPGDRLLEDPEWILLLAFAGPREGLEDRLAGRIFPLDQADCPADQPVLDRAPDEGPGAEADVVRPDGDPGDLGDRSVGGGGGEDTDEQDRDQDFVEHFSLPEKGTYDLAPVA